MGLTDNSVSKQVKFLLVVKRKLRIMDFQGQLGNFFKPDVGKVQQIMSKLPLNVVLTIKSTYKQKTLLMLKIH